MLVGRLVFLAGAIVLLHCARVNFEYKTYLNLVDLPYESASPTTILYTFFGIFLCAIGATLATKPFLPIAAAKVHEHETIDSALSQMQFYSFGHRGVTPHLK
eukprot:c5463_g1_i1.p1 GENE.c5463_g1_i1~~c5463_g1_i1.p1  ORF type:complete len:102 (-),score=11.35 c5463_g1_i1:114-419(-)